MAGATPRTIRLQDLPGDVSLSGVAQGDLFFRGASKWNNLAAGTAGNLLATGGSGANPSWASRLTYASSGTILTITDGATTDVPLVVNAVTSQSGNLQQWKVNGSQVAAIGADGHLGIGISPSSTYLVDAVGSGTVTQRIRTSTNNYAFLALETSVASMAIGVTSGVMFFLPTGTTSFVPFSLTSGGATTLGTIGMSVSPLTVIANSGTTPLIVRGATSQSAPLLQLQGQSSTTAGRAQAEVDTAWAVDTDASRSADLILRAYYTTTAREGLRIRGGSSDVQLGFYGVTPISRAVLATGAGATADDIITALQNLGLVKQS